MALQGLLKAAVGPAARAAVSTSAGRAGSTAALRAPSQNQKAAAQGVSTLNHAARSFAAHAAAVEAPPAPIVASAPSVDGSVEVRSLSDQGLQFKFLVPSGVVGAVLGRGGGTVSAIKRQTGAYVQFTRPGTATNSPKDRMMIVAVEERAQLAAAMDMILEAIEREGALEKLRTKQFAADRLFMQQVIPAICAGKVMGPGGEGIKALSERTGCSVVVEGKAHNAAFVPFRLVNYLAPGAANIVAAVAQVADQICQEDKYEAGIRELTSVCFKIVEIPERKVGALLGPQGSHIKSLQEVLRCKMGVADNSNKPGSRFVSIWGAPLNVKVAIEVVMLATGMLQQQAAGVEGSTAPSTPRSARFPASLSPSVNGDFE